jgi:ribosome-binding protein aMBF1 (putative translation factor)
MDGQLRQIRETQALSRKDLADKSEVSESAIYRAEHGETKLRPSTRRKLAKALGVKPAELASSQGRLGI